MTIGTNDAIDKFGTQDTVTAGGGTSAVSDGAFSAAADAESWTNDDDAPLIAAVLTTVAGQSAPAAGKHVRMYARPLDIDGTADAPSPDANFQAVFIGAFLLDAAAGVQSVPLVSGHAALPNHYSSQAYEFYWENGLGVELAAGWTVKVTPVTQGPHA